MKQSNIIDLSEDQISYGEYLNNFQKYRKNENMHQNKIDFILPLYENSEYFKKPQEKISLEEIKNIMEDSKSEMTDDDSTEQIYFVKKPKISSNENKSTFNTTKSISQEKLIFETFEENKTKKISFRTILHRKRGRKIIKKQEKSNKRRIHGSSDFDNVQRKIQVHFINFLIRLANDAIKTFLGKNSKYIFKDIKYELKKVVSHKYIEHLKQCKFSDIIQMEVSQKIKSYEDYSNKETYLEICKISPELKELFEKKYIYIFQKLYLGLKKNQNIIDFDGLKISLSPYTKGFPTLLKKNEFGKEKFDNVIQDVYISSQNYLNKNKFVTYNPYVSNNL